MMCHTGITLPVTVLLTWLWSSDGIGTQTIYWNSQQTTAESEDNRWSYKIEEIGGPKDWGMVAGQHLCQIGKKQSPVDIKTDRLVFDHTLDKFVISAKDEPLEILVENVGQDLHLSVPPDHIYFNGGPFPYNYQVFGMRVKFGSISSRGSDHLINGQALPGELQIYAFNSDLYNNHTHATTRPHGLTAVGVFFQLSNRSNKDLVGVVAAAAKTTFKGETFHLKGLELRALLSSTQEYITYEGSLPFPGCHETVTWVILNHPILISETELKTLRRLRIANTLWSGFMADNFRPVQSMNNRSIRTNINMNSEETNCQISMHLSYTTYTQHSRKINSKVPDPSDQSIPWVLRPKFT